MKVDSFRFLPRSFRALYEDAELPASEPAGPVWAPFEKRLSGSRVALVTSAGLHLRSQPAFDLDGERARPQWGDPSWRAIPATTPGPELRVAHLHINDADILADPEIALPMRTLAGLVQAGMVGSAVATHISVMGFQEAGLEGWRTGALPEIVALLRAEGADGVVLAPV